MKNRLLSCACLVAAMSGCSLLPDSSTSFTVTVTADNVTVSPSGTITVQSGSNPVFTVTANTGFELKTAVEGTCPAGTWAGSVYTTGAVLADCSVAFSATAKPTSVQVTASGDSRETISPSTPQTVTAGDRASFTVTAKANYTLSPTVGGTCPAGTWDAAVYTTAVVTADCTVTFSATPNGFEVTASGDGFETILPELVQVVAGGDAAVFKVIVNEGSTLSTTVGGTCPAGKWSDTLYKTGVITGDCTVSFSVVTYTVTASGDGSESFTPKEPQSVASGTSLSYVVTPIVDYVPSLVTGTCPVGTWAGDVYTTGPIVNDCTVIFSAVPLTYTVTASGDGNESFSPSDPQTTIPGKSLSYVVTANEGYLVSPTVGGTCPPGTWAADVYTTGLITADCTVTFSATLRSYTVTVSGDGYESFTPNTPQTVSHGSAPTFTVFVVKGYMLLPVGGTCPAGAWSGNSFYKPGPITADCTIIFSTAPVCDYTCLTCNAPGVNSCTSCATGGTIGNATPVDIYAVQGQSFTPMVTGNGNSALQADSGGNVLLKSFKFAFEDPATAPSKLYIYTSLPATVADGSAGVGSVGTGTNDGTGTGTYIFNPPLSLPYMAKAYAMLPGSYNIHDDLDAYPGGEDFFPDDPPFPGFFLGGHDVGFTATFVGRTLQPANVGACELP